MNREDCVIWYHPGGFKSASATPNLLKQVFNSGGNRLQSVLSNSSGIDPALKAKNATEVADYEPYDD